MEHFNSYLSNIDGDLIKELCINKGKLIHFNKKEYFLKTGEVNLYIGFIVHGIFKYTCTNTSENREYNVGFTFPNEFVADYPGCFYDKPSEVDIQALTACDVYLCEARELHCRYQQSIDTQRLARINAEQLLLQIFSRYVDFYRKSPEERYRDLLKKCPELLQVITLKELASYLKITPTTMSYIRRKITFEK